MISELAIILFKIAEHKSTEEGCNKSLHFVNGYIAAVTQLAEPYRNMCVYITFCFCVQRVLW